MKLTTPLPVYLLNLDRHSDRLAKMEEQLQVYTDVSLNVVPGVLGSSLPRVAINALVQDHSWQNKKGAIGCFLSHVNAWEQIALAEHNYGIIFEDDTKISDLASLLRIELPEDLDILYLNDRMSPLGPSDSRKVVSMRSSLSLLRLRDDKGAGGDGYLITTECARKLIRQISTDGFYGHVDGRLLRYSLSSTDIDSLADDPLLRSIVLNHHSSVTPPAYGILNAYAVSPPITYHLGLIGERILGDKESIPSQHIPIHPPQVP